MKNEKYTEERLTGIGLGAGAGVMGSVVGLTVGSSVGLHTSTYLQSSSASRMLSATRKEQQSSTVSKKSGLSAFLSYPFEHLVTPSIVIM
jgi:hypothetical protein